MLGRAFGYARSWIINIITWKLSIWIFMNSCSIPRACPQWTTSKTQAFDRESNANSLLFFLQSDFWMLEPLADHRGPLRLFVGNNSSDFHKLKFTFEIQISHQNSNALPHSGGEQNVGEQKIWDFVCSPPLGGECSPPLRISLLKKCSKPKTARRTRLQAVLTREKTNIVWKAGLL